ncbi:hypothetical protein [Clostridium magnum]|uniref:Uncharacterized protein n=1 Tax=Clostridium magnum DSM 2767 TaxID=1121326 RepID=A0A162QMZ6_9CLOT|nr:hypothetical protein [Clostridium magnum]KZL88733.1 hypothetical protein CLMAG_60220 [Clostridium magnum DSM 2767]SHJ61986.1 hypothetical protein SAMN02745944_06248 [Clostridium magnum DSM 2767]
MKIKSKPIIFTDNERDILNWSESQSKPFGTYVKDLIRDDIKRNRQYPKEELKGIIKEILQEMNLDTKNIKSDSENKINSKLGAKGKKAYKNFLNSSD